MHTILPVFLLSFSCHTLYSFVLRESWSISSMIPSITSWNIPEPQRPEQSSSRPDPIPIALNHCKTGTLFSLIWYSLPFCEKSVTAICAFSIVH